MKTVTIQIGNSDNKLAQVDWANYVSEVRRKILRYCYVVHFFGGSSNWENWQNVAWVITGEDDNLALLLVELIEIRIKFQQDSIAWTEGKTQFC